MSVRENKFVKGKYFHFSTDKETSYSIFSSLLCFLNGFNFLKFIKITAYNRLKLKWFIKIEMHTYYFHSISYYCLLKDYTSVSNNLVVVAICCYTIENIE